MQKNIPYRVEKELSTSDKIKYYENLRKKCERLSTKNKKSISSGQYLISKVYNPSFYNNKLEIHGIENIPYNESVIFICNHSNAHDIFSMYSILEKLNIPASVMVATDCLNPLSISVFAAADSTFLDRRNKLSANQSIYDLSSKIIAGKSGVIFGESTWNLHPIKPMQNLKIGGAKIAAITGAVIIPTIMEYIEIPDLFNKEGKMYEKIVISFGKPIKVEAGEDLATKTHLIQNKMEEMRKKIWQQNLIIRENLDMIIPEQYINHVYLKKFKAFGFTYDSLKESQFLRKDEDGQIENEYCINAEGELVPGITYKKCKH